MPGKRGMSARSCPPTSCAGKAAPAQISGKRGQRFDELAGMVDASAAIVHQDDVAGLRRTEPRGDSTSNESYLFGISPTPINGTAPPPVTWGSIPFHFSMALRLASILLSSIRSGEIFALWSLKASASAFAVVILCSASIFILSRSLSALSASCSAVCLSSMAAINILEKLKPTIENASTAMLCTMSLSVRVVLIASLTADLLVISSSAEYLADTAFTTSCTAGSMMRSLKCMPRV